jgi:hypothetical protein
MGVVAYAGLRRHHPLTHLETARQSFFVHIRNEGRCSGRNASGKTIEKGSADGA